MPSSCRRRCATIRGGCCARWKRGQAKLNGYLEDYATVADGLLELYQTTFDTRWFAAARSLGDAILTHFADPDGGFFDTSDDHEELLVRPKNVQDGASPSGGAMATGVLLRLASVHGRGRVRAGCGSRAGERERGHGARTARLRLLARRARGRDGTAAGARHRRRETRRHCSRWRAAGTGRSWWSRSEAPSRRRSCRCSRTARPSRRSARRRSYAGGLRASGP